MNIEDIETLRTRFNTDEKAARTTTVCEGTCKKVCGGNCRSHKGGDSSYLTGLDNIS